MANNNYSGAARKALTPQDPRALSADEIQQLREAGYDVIPMNDYDPALFGWIHVASEAKQSDWKEHQPYRRSRDQAWVDCQDYAGCNLPSTPTPDWLS
ncbi:MAG: hypothetical protein K0M67_01365 [Thiobacillus sp.]|uniref:Uncharacterized protein n=1 Tax=Hydrogenophaga aromaticivorans TaxID=2610898 RepID=A0A7Y8GWD8_9BURK|nr:hypothetical protein [Hydrogenophaga aromaticivorans]MBW8466884.1 hypothetical protein [Thiobacillus sp.]NWF46070.1 hypothetical protein [Hydrogenophaga aromaticivorans]